SFEPLRLCDPASAGQHARFALAPHRVGDTGAHCSRVAALILSATQVSTSLRRRSRSRGAFLSDSSFIQHSPRARSTVMAVWVGGGAGGGGGGGYVFRPAAVGRAAGASAREPSVAVDWAQAVSAAAATTTTTRTGARTFITGMKRFRS